MRHRFVFWDRRGMQCLGRENALGQIIEALEDAPCRSRHLARMKKVFEGDLPLVPAPPIAGTAAWVGKIADGGRPIGLHMSTHLIDIGLLIAGEFFQIFVLAFAGERAIHLPADQGIEFEGQEARLMRPIFEKTALALAEGALVERVVAVMAGAREDGEVMRAHQHIDAVDLQEIHLGDGVLDARPVGGAVAMGMGEPLRDQSETARLQIGQRVALGHVRTLRISIKRSSKPKSR
jgi:hypothetical protein